MSLAPQSVYPRLVVKRAAANSDDFQLASRALFPYYDVRDRLTEPDPSAYSIESLPGTVYSLPRGSIFDFISFLPSDLPDFRVVPVVGSKSIRPTGAKSASGTAAPSTVPIVIDAQTPAMFMNSRRSANNTTPIFKVAGPLVDGAGAGAGSDEDDMPSVGDPDDSDAMGLRRLGEEPMALDEYSVKEFLGSEYNSFELLLTDATYATNKPRSRDEVLRNVVAHFNVSESDLLSVSSGRNRLMTKKNVKLGIAIVVLKTMNVTMVARINEELANRLATIIGSAVEIASD